MKDGTVTVTWRPGVRLDLPRFKAAVMRWRGAVRYGGATVTVVGKVADQSASWERGRDERSGHAGGTPALPGTVLIAAETGQRFRLSGKETKASEALPPGELIRVTGRVIRGGEEKENEIWLELERAATIREGYEDLRRSDGSK